MTTNFPKPLDKQVAAISDSLSQTQDGLAIVANGNTHAAISSGQFVYVKGHDTLSEGLYKATSAIAANGTLSTSNLTPDGSGGLNDLQGQLTTLNSNLVYQYISFSTTNANITEAERKSVRKYGRLCIIDITFTVGTDITGDTVELFSGLPHAIIATRFRLAHGYDATKPPLTLAITTDGKIVNQWSNGGIRTGQWAGQALYIADE